MFSFTVLGPLTMRSGQDLHAPRGPKVRKLLALLLLRPGNAVDTSTVAEELWDSNPPRTEMATIRTHVYHLRTLLEQQGSSADRIALLSTQPGGGYALRIEPSQLDAAVFTQLLDRGRGLLAEGRNDRAAQTLRSALALWQGPALANVVPGRVLSRYVAQLEEQRIRAVELRVEADMRMGRYRELIAELRGLVVVDPLNEWFHAQLIDALRRCGRRGEALDAYRNLHDILDRELGIEPSVELKRLQYEILAANSLSRINRPAFAGDFGAQAG
jgi:DNA-binding SARP family transcriptional activator